MGLEETFKAQLEQWKLLEREALAAEAHARTVTDPDAAQAAAVQASRLRKQADDFLAAILGPVQPRSRRSTDDGPGR